MARVEPIDLDQRDSASSAGVGGVRSDRSIKVRPMATSSDSRRGSAPTDNHALDHASAPGAVVYLMRHVARRAFMRSGWYESVIAITIRKFLRGKCFTLVTLLSLFVALFMSEIFSVAQVPENDSLNVILTIVFAVFALEFVGLSMTDTSYLLGFFFWMDLLGTCSMIFDISFMLGPDVTMPDHFNHVQGSSSSQNMIVVRATRATKIGARAGRITRVLKILRFLPFLLRSDQDDHVKMAKVISNQLTNALSTRVAFLTICIVICMPLFTMFTYPEEDDSMVAWTQLLALSAERYHRATAGGNATAVELSKSLLLSEIENLRRFYSTVSYGPYKVEYGESTAAGVFTPLARDLGLSALSWTFSEPARLSSARIITQERFQAYFDLSSPKQQEAGSSLGLICFVMLVMLVFGLVMSSSISVVALQPLERMLSVVRERCTQIFKYTDNLREEQDSDADQESEEYDDMEHNSEFVLLEKVVSKLAAIASLSTTKQEPELKDNMNENDMLVLSWMQGTQVSRSSGRGTIRGSSVLPKGPVAGRDHRSAPIAELPEVDFLRGGTKLSEAMLEAIETDTFHVLDSTKEFRIAVAHHILTSSHGGWTGWVRTNVAETTLATYLAHVESLYTQSPFHNFAHAVDVEQTSYRYMMMTGTDRFFSEQYAFSVLIAATGHDVGHTGVNNPYLIETGHELALRYNDRSPLENMHCSKLFQIVSTKEANIFSQIEKDLYKEMRQIIIDCILHTDVTKHGDMIKDMGMLYQINSEAFDGLNPEAAISSQKHLQLIGSMLLHGADVSNPVKPWDLCQRYAHLCMDEFFAQGDLEKQAGIPVQMLNDRTKVSRPNGQIGFMEFFIAPMVTEMIHMFPQYASLGERFCGNISMWAEVWQNEADPPQDAVARLSVRINRICDNMQSLVKDAEARVRAATSY